MKPKSFTNFDGPEISKKPPGRDDLHDIIILPKNAVAPNLAAQGQVRPRVQRFPINRSTGHYEKTPEDLAVNEDGGRKVRAIAAPAEDYGPGIVLAPTRPEPAAQNGTCIIINQENLRIRNAWTAARLDNEPPAKAPPEGTAAAVEEEPDEYKERLSYRDQDEQFELLVASAQGTVFLVSANAKPRPIENLGLEGEIWYQLRNGFVAGSVYCRELDRVLPMVNVMSLVKVAEPAKQEPAS